jgi:hypothetical protein
VLSFSHLAPRPHDLGSLFAGERIIGAGGVGQLRDDADHAASDGKRDLIAGFDASFALDALWNYQPGLRSYHNSHSRTAIAGHFSP